MVNAPFIVSATSDKIWNLTDLIQFLSSQQNKHIVLDINPEAICLTNLGLYDILDCFSFASVTILTCNLLEVHGKYKIWHKKINHWFESIVDIDKTLFQWTLSKKFLCLYHRPTAARIGIGSYMYQNHRNNSHVHFSIGTDIDNLVHYELDKLLSWDFQSIETAGNLIKQLPVELMSSDRYTQFNGYDYRDPLTALYQDIFVDLVVESHVAGNTFFPTEKTVRPILLKKPFIVFGSKNYLEYLRQMGFRTFGDFWDEDYDGYDGKDRYTKILKLIDSIAAMPFDRLETMYWDMQYSLEHNYNLLVSKNYSTQITPL
jgi:hypothetical protein